MQIEKLTSADLEKFPVWEFTDNDEDDETDVRPVGKTPVKNLINCLVATQAKLANGASVWALIGDIDTCNPQLTKHFLTLSVLQNGTWFTMARYHDIDADTRGPRALTEFLGLRISDVFPISYDINQHSLGNQDALVGKIEMEPKQRLTRAQLIALAAP